jgi:two-component system, LytTR family, sensor kinase
MKRTLLVFCIFLNSKLSICQQKNEILDLQIKLNTVKDTARINTLNKLSKIYILKTKLDSAALYQNIALSEAQKVNYQKGMLDAYNNIGNLNLIKGNLPEATNFYLKALSICEKTGAKKDLIPIYINISAVYVKQHQFKESQQYLDNAWKLAIEIKDSVRLTGIYNNYATILANTGKSDSAIFYLRNSINISSTIENNEEIDKGQLNHYKQNALLGIGLMLSRKGEGKIVTQMLDSLWGKESIASGTDSKVKVLIVLSENAQRQNDFSKAIDYANYALSIDSGYNNPTLMAGFYNILGDCYSEQKNYQKAYEARTLQLKFADSLFSREKISVVNEIQAKYETEKKDSQINALNKSKKLQWIIIGLSIVAICIALVLLWTAQKSKRNQAELFVQKEILQTKEKEIEVKDLQKKTFELEQMALRAQMNPHFIFNSINSVQHFVMRQDMEGVNKYLSNFAHLIRQTLNNSGKATISLEEEIKYLETYLSLEKIKSDNAFIYTVILDAQINAAEVFIPGMILQPFVENSIKHGVLNKKEKDGIISILISKEDMLVCEISDNGIGIEKANEIKHNDNVVNYESKGMNITMNRINMINKLNFTSITVKIENITNEINQISGTSVKIKFPLDFG